MFSLESPHQGDSNEYPQYTILIQKRILPKNYPKSAAVIFFKGTREQVRNSHGKRVINVDALYLSLPHKVIMSYIF